MATLSNGAGTLSQLLGGKKANMRNSRNGKVVVGAVVGTLLFGGLLSGLAFAQALEWNLVGSTIESDLAVDDLFGVATEVSATGDRLIVGTARQDGIRDAPGRVRVFELVDGEWTQLGSDLVGESAGHGFGSEVDISSDGTRIAVGAWLKSTDVTTSGQVRVFDLVNGEWAQVGADINGTIQSGRLGSGLDMSQNGNRLVVGGNGNSATDNSAGFVMIFNLVNDGWVQVGRDINGAQTDDFSGSEVAISADGTRVGVGAGAHDGDLLGQDRVGHVRIFDLTNGEWTQVGDDIDGVTTLGFFGRAFALSADGNTVVAADDTGQVRAFTWIDGEWTQRGNTIINADSADVATDATGQRIIVTAGPNLARIFQLTQDQWIQVGEDLPGEPDRGARGYAVAMTPDGETVVAASADRRNRAGDTNYIRVFEQGVQQPSPTTTTTTTPPPQLIPVLCNGLKVTVNLAFGETPTSGDDVIRGTSGNDTIDALAGNDTICALQGDDTIIGGGGFDKIFAGAGNDSIDGGLGNDLLIGGKGTDAIDGGNGNDRIQGGDGNDELMGGNGKDRINGGNGNDVIRGGKFDDRLFGNLGRDQLFGDQGNDVLRGGAWKDTMDGGAGDNDGCTLTDPGGLTETRNNCEGGVFGR